MARKQKAFTILQIGQVESSVKNGPGGASSWSRSENSLGARHLTSVAAAQNGVRPTPLWHHRTIAGCNCWVIDLIIYSALKIIKASPQSREWYGRWLCLRRTKCDHFYNQHKALIRRIFFNLILGGKNNKNAVILSRALQVGLQSLLLLRARETTWAWLTCQMTQEMLMVQSACISIKICIYWHELISLHIVTRISCLLCPRT